MQHKPDESFTNGLSGYFCQLRLLTCICFCGWDVWVAGANAFSRGPRTLSLPSELIIYSIYKTLYVQNRKICKGRQSKKKKRISDKLFWNWHLHTKFSYKVVTTEATPWMHWRELFHAGICVIGTVVNPYCTITDSPWGCKTWSWPADRAAWLKI